MCTVHLTNTNILNNDFLASANNNSDYKRTNIILTRMKKTIKHPQIWNGKNELRKTMKDRLKPPHPDNAT